jgi:aspartate/methionine/tyrosine aminotransferase
MGTVTTFREPLAKRMSRLGTETAYAVSLEAGSLKASGKTIYPFHIGDLNFRTPEVVVDACKKALDDGLHGYCPAAGIPELRAAMAEYYNETFGLRYSPENVSVQSGGKPAIGKFLQCLCNEGDEVLYPSPGYPIYESVANYLGTVPVSYQYEMMPDKTFKLDLAALKAKIRPGVTRAIFLNDFQNPMGVAHSRAELEAIAQLCKEHDIFVFSDDPYHAIRFNLDKEFVHIATIPGMADRTLCGFTFSKSYAMTGWRLGAAIGPKWLIEQVTKINTNDEACTTHFIQKAGVTALTHPEAKAFTTAMVAELRVRRDLLAGEIDSVRGFTAFTPESTFYMMVDVTEAMRLMGVTDLELFRKRVLADTGVSFCTRAHFGTPIKGETVQLVRFAFSGVTVDVIKKVGEVLRPYMDAFSSGL